MNARFNLSYIIGISFAAALGGYLFGFDFAVITGGLPFLVDHFGLGAEGEGGLTASLALGAVIGCLVAGYLADTYGRKPGLLIAALIFAGSSIAMGVAGNLTVFIAARFVAGIGVGIASMLSPMYIAEVSPGPLRGRLVSIYQLTIVLGILITHLVNFGLKDLGPDAWRWMFGSGAAPSVLFLLGVLVLPESPRYLVSKGKIDQAFAVLNKMGGEEFARTTISDIQKTLQGSTDGDVSVKELFKKAYLPIVGLGIGLAVFQQWCGINVVFNYTAKIFEAIGANREEQLIQAVYIGIANLVFTLVAMTLVDKFGRKPLMLFGAGGLAILYLVIFGILQSGDGGLLSPFVIAAIGTYAISLAPVTWVLISEIFPNKIRGKALSVATISLWIAYSVLVFTFPILAENMGEASPFLAYAVICVLGFLLIWFKLTETKGKTLEEVEGSWTGGGH